MPICNLSFDLLLFYFASKAGVRSYFNLRIYPRFLFWKRRNQIGASLRRPSAWGEVASCAGKFKLPEFGGTRGCNSAVLHFTVIPESEEARTTRGKKRPGTNQVSAEGQPKTTYLSGKLSVGSGPFNRTDNPNVLSLPQIPVFIRVRGLPDSGSPMFSCG